MCLGDIFVDFIVVYVNLSVIFVWLIIGYWELAIRVRPTFNIAFDGHKQYEIFSIFELICNLIVRIYPYTTQSYKRN